MHLSDLWTVWPVAGPWQLSPLTGGTINLIWRAETSDRQCYALRLIPDLTNLAQLRYEIALLEALSSQLLPFQLPLPLKTRAGDHLVQFEQETGTPAIALLSPLLPGHAADRNDLATTSHAAITLARLDHALAALPEVQLPAGFQPLPTFGELRHWHPLVPDPLAALERLPIEHDQARQIRLILTTLQETLLNLYIRLPQQLIHRDYDYSNILVENHQVTAVLDFEFAAPDLRVFDVCVALSWWPINVMGTGKEWSIIDTFGAAYVSHFPLLEEELLAIPALLRLRDATSLVYRIGRYFAGQETDTRIQHRIQHSLWREAWLSAHQNQLLEHVMSWHNIEDNEM
jgi:homoserine kinase type II